MKTNLLHKALIAVALIMGSANVWGATETITITVSSINDGGAVLGSNNYNSGAERAWTQNSISFGGKAITQGNSANVGAIQAQASNGVIYNTTALPGKIVDIVITNNGTNTNTSSCYGGSTERLVNSTSADYTVVIGGTQIGSASAIGWTSADFTGTAYTYFAIKRGTGAAYWSSIAITYETSAATQAAIPTATPASGNIAPQSITLVGTNVDNIYYSTDGKQGTYTLYSSAIPVSTATTIWAYAVKSGLDNSDTVSFEYTFEPAITLSHATLNFGNKLVGATPDTLSIAVKDAINISDLTAVLAHGTAQFVITNADIDETKAATVAGDTLKIAFNPTAIGDYNDTLLIKEGATIVKSVPLAGKVIDPSIVTDSAQVRIKAVVGSTLTVPVRITANYLADSIEVSLVDNAFFSLPNGKLAVADDGVRTTTLNVTYTPTVSGTHTDTLRLVSGGITKYIPLSGNAIVFQFEENFEYPVGDKLTAHGWKVHSGTANDTVAVTEGLSFPDYIASGIGGAAAVTSGGIDVNKQFGMVVTTGKVYMSFMFKTESNNSAGYFMHLAQVENNGTTNTGTAWVSRLFVPANGAWIGISESGTAPSEEAQLPITPGDTYLGVVEFDFTTKKSNLYVFSSFPASQPASGYVTSATAASASNIGAVALRQYNSSQKITVDGIRLATTWAEAVKAAPCAEPTGLTASSVTKNSATVSWTAPIHTPTLGYQLAYKPTAELAYNYVLVSGVNHQLTGLTQATNYSYKVRSICRAGDTSAWSTEETFATLSASAPSLAITSPTPGTTYTDSVQFTFVTENVTLGVDATIKLKIGNDSVYLSTNAVKKLYYTPNTQGEQSYTAEVTLFDAYGDPLATDNVTYKVDLPDVAAIVPSISAGTYYAAQTVTLSCATEGAAIEYKKGANAVYQPYTTAISITGNDTIFARANKVNMDAATLTAAYKIVTPVSVANLADLRSHYAEAPTSGTGNVVYKLTNPVIFVHGSTSRNVKYVQDATAAIVIDDNAGIITTTYAAGDGIANLMGTLLNYNNLLQFIPVADPGVAVSHNNEIVIKNTTVADIKDNIREWQSQLVRIENATFISPAATFGTGNSATNHDIISDGETIVLRTSMRDADYVGTAIPTAAMNITGFLTEYNGAAQITPRSLSDITTHNGEEQEVPNAIYTSGNTDLVVYPNPVYNGQLVIDKGQLTSRERVEVFNIFGALVGVHFIGEGQTIINLAGLSNGLYIVRVNNKVAKVRKE